MTTNTRIRIALGHAILPLVGAGYLLWFIFAEVGRLHRLPDVIVFGSFIAVAIGLSAVQPIASLIIVSALLALQLSQVGPYPTDHSWPEYFGILVVVGVTAAAKAPWIQLASAIFSIIATVVVVGILTVRGWDPNKYPVFGIRTSGSSWERYAWVFLPAAGMVLLAWLIGFTIRQLLRRVSAERTVATVGTELRGAEVELSIARERDRIAGEVHDIMAHSLTVIIAQADGSRYLGRREPAAMADSLEQISDSARASLIELRLLLESLVTEPEGHTYPGLDKLDSLYFRMRTAGLPLSVLVLGDAPTPTTPLGTGTQLAIYRIIQESLTNALRHSGARSDTLLTLDWRGQGLALTVVSRCNGPAPERAAVDGQGLGIAGMMERARLTGGWLSAQWDDSAAHAGDAEDGSRKADERTFIVTAFIPTDEAGSGRELLAPLSAPELASALALAPTTAVTDGETEVAR